VSRATHPHLDGGHENFIDTIHFSPEGERQMAENVFVGISNVLKEDLVLTNGASADSAPMRVGNPAQFR
jgi:hypothetical protein